ncbi:MAG: hypothetical protein GYB50_04055 [Rhodobacteraceae bacterium]|nr:hypothetical protein [Paracoccaceae bacterium]
MSGRSRRRFEQRVRELSEYMDPEDVADTLRIRLGDVLLVLGRKAPKQTPAVVIDAKTQNVSHHVSFRSAYRHVCVAGLVDWTWHTREAYVEWCRINGVTP